jgi:hypothetical protein
MIFIVTYSYNTLNISSFALAKYLGSMLQQCSIFTCLKPSLPQQGSYLTKCPGALASWQAHIYYIGQEKFSNRQIILESTARNSGSVSGWTGWLKNVSQGTNKNLREIMEACQDSASDRQCRSLQQQESASKHLCHYYIPTTKVSWSSLKFPEEAWISGCTLGCILRRASVGESWTQPLAYSNECLLWFRVFLAIGWRSGVLG